MDQSMYIKYMFYSCIILYYNHIISAKHLTFIFLNMGYAIMVKMSTVMQHIKSYFIQKQATDILSEACCCTKWLQTLTFCETNLRNT